MGEWGPFKLGELCQKIGSGATPTGGKDSYLDHGEFALIRSQNVHLGGFSRDGLAYIDHDQAKALANVEVMEDDVLLNITGDSVARSCQVDPGVLPARVNQHVAILRPRRDRIDARLLRFLLIAPSYQASLRQLASGGATRPALTKAAIERFAVTVPTDLNEQRSISVVLGAIEDKIDVNRRMAATLENMARALFKSWFVDFDPVRARADGRDPDSSCGVASLFPDQLVGTSGGTLPAGWRFVPLSELAALTNKTVAPGKQPDVIWTHFSIPAFDEHRRPSSDVGSSIKSGKYLVPADCILISKLNPATPRVWMPDVQDPDRSICSTEFLPFRPKEPVDRSYLFELLRSKPFGTAVQARVTGSTGSRQRALPGSVASIQVVDPGSHLRRAFSAVASPLHQGIARHIRQSATLTDVRDALLPKLVSGEVRIADPEGFLARMEAVG